MGHTCGVPCRPRSTWNGPGLGEGPAPLRAGTPSKGRSREMKPAEGAGGGPAVTRTWHDGRVLGAGHLPRSFRGDPLLHCKGTCPGACVWPGVPGGALVLGQAGDAGSQAVPAAPGRTAPGVKTRPGQQCPLDPWTASVGTVVLRRGPEPGSGRLGERPRPHCPGAWLCQGASSFPLEQDGG